MSKTIRGIITDCVAGISILLVLGVAFFIYDLGLQHVYQELHELRAELSSVKQRNQELETKMRFIEDGVHEETFSRLKDDEFDQPEIPSAEFELSSEVQALNEPDTCTTASMQETCLMMFVFGTFRRLKDQRPEEKVVSNTNGN